jgi:hypothetical protein
MSVVVHLNAVMGGGPTQHLISQSAPDSFESFSWHISTLGGGSHFNVLLSDDGTLAPGHHKSYFSNGNFVALDNTWHTLGFTFHAPTSTLKLYVDGRENIGASKEFDDAITSINPETSLNFANDLNSVRHWAGSLDDVKIYDRALSGREMHILNVNPYLGLQT